MSILVGDRLKPEAFFKVGQPKAQGSSFDLKIGKIFGHDGNAIEGPFVLKPGHIVQVMSQEIFDLPSSVTGHVTYKTNLTQQGIWALTVGIVDPGWDGPIATTLLNFSRNDFSIAQGDVFLRVTMFEHAPVPEDKLRRMSSNVAGYERGIQGAAATQFPSTFLNIDDITNVAGDKVLKKIREEALGWIVGIAVIFTIVQIILALASTAFDRVINSVSEDSILSSRVDHLDVSVDSLTRKLELLDTDDAAILRAELARLLETVDEAEIGVDDRESTIEDPVE